MRFALLRKVEDTAIQVINSEIVEAIMPVFFALLSLIVFGLMLLVLRREERERECLNSKRPDLLKLMRSLVDKTNE